MCPSPKQAGTSQQGNMLPRKRGFRTILLAGSVAGGVAVGLTDLGQAAGDAIEQALKNAGLNSIPLLLHPSPQGLHRGKVSPFLGAFGPKVSQSLLCGPLYPRGSKGAGKIFDNQQTHGAEGRRKIGGLTPR